MSVGDRIKKIRNMRGMTQKELGLAAGFDEKSADIRIAQYESGTRTPKEKIITKIADVLKVNSKTLERPDIDSAEGIIHTLFMLEDIYGIQIANVNGKLCLLLDKSKSSIYPTLFDMFNTWQKEAEKFRNGEITEEEYSAWRYSYHI
ncbi:MAG: helix-turn-helix domain-containing protein [Oscillospiraceae bacterium]|nr:helix-turn-helix domain-containing protein [Oscillospiraceae bacterium]